MFSLDDLKRPGSACRRSLKITQRYVCFFNARVVTLCRQLYNAGDALCIVSMRELHTEAVNERVETRPLRPIKEHEINFTLQKTAAITLNTAGNIMHHNKTHRGK